MSKVVRRKASQGRRPRKRQSTCSFRFHAKPVPSFYFSFFFPFLPMYSLEKRNRQSHLPALSGCRFPSFSYFLFRQPIYLLHVSNSHAHAKRVRFTMHCNTCLFYTARLLLDIMCLVSYDGFSSYCRVLVLVCTMSRNNCLGLLCKCPSIFCTPKAGQ